MNEWQLQTLDSAGIEFIDGDRGKNYPSQDDFHDIGYCLFLSTKNVRANGFDFSDCQFISAEKDSLLRKGKLNRGDIVLTTRGTVGNTAHYNESVLCDHVRINSGMVIIRMNPLKVDSSFFLHFLRQLDYTSFVSGSAQPQLPIRDLKQIEIALPPLPEQKAIASVLASLDDKIDLLHRQNKTLEAMAETLFRQWFIEEAKEDWEDGVLGELGHIVCGKTPSKSNDGYFGNDVPFLKIPDMHGKVFISRTLDNLSRLGAASQSKKTIPKNSICVSCIATVGLVCITDCDLQTNQQINSIIPYDTNYLYYIYFVMKNMYDDLQNLASGGTATLNLNTGDFSRITITKPSNDALLAFNQIADPMLEKIRSNALFIQTLEQLRDTLLPKLMSGEVRVQYQTEQIA